MNIHPRLSVPGCMALSGFAHPLGGREPQTEGSDQARGEAAQRRMRRCCHSLVALGHNRKTIGPKLAKKKKTTANQPSGILQQPGTVVMRCDAD